jgi:hypothetical protein
MTNFNHDNPCPDLNNIYFLKHILVHVRGYPRAPIEPHFPYRFNGLWAVGAKNILNLYYLVR